MNKNSGDQPEVFWLCIRAWIKEERVKQQWKVENWYKELAYWLAVTMAG